MFKLDNEFLTSLGLGSLPVDEKNKLLQAIYERLEMNVGMRLAEKMTDQQLDEFEGFIDRSDEAGALRWLETNFPNYKQVVAEELEKLKAEIMQSAPQILAAAQTPVTQQAPGEPGPASGQPQQQYSQPPQPQQQAVPQQPGYTSDYSQPMPQQPQPPIGDPGAVPQQQPPQPQQPYSPPAPQTPWQQPPAGPQPPAQ